MTQTQLAVEKVMAELATSQDPNDHAFCQSMASLLFAWTEGNAQEFLHKIKMVENRHALMSNYGTFGGAIAHRN